MSLDIKILIATHKLYWMPKEDVYLPIQVGAAGHDTLGYIQDDEGLHISEKNPHYCELTGLYWAWKNLKSDYIGLVHYRRYFVKERAWTVEGKKAHILGASDWEALLAKYPVILPDRRNYYIETNRSHYNHAHPREGLDVTEEIIKELYPAYLEAFHLVMNRTWAHMFNMFVMRADLYEAYMEWLFTILFELEKRLDISSYDSYQARVFGFVAERLLDVWIEQNQIAYKEQQVAFIEPQNWIKKGASFLKRKVWGH